MKTTKWCVVATHWEELYFHESALSNKRTDSIKKFMNAAAFKSWRIYRREGWKCVKVEMTLEII